MVSSQNFWKGSSPAQGINVKVVHGIQCGAGVSRNPQREWKVICITTELFTL